MHMRGFCWMQLKGKGDYLSGVMNWMQPGHSSLPFSRSLKRKTLSPSIILMVVEALLGLTI